MINLHESIGTGWDQSRFPLICSANRNIDMFSALVNVVSKMHDNRIIPSLSKLVNNGKYIITGKGSILDIYKASITWISLYIFLFTMILIYTSAALVSLSIIILFQNKILKM